MKLGADAQHLVEQDEPGGGTQHQRITHLPGNRYGHADSLCGQALPGHDDHAIEHNADGITIHSTIII